MNETDLALGMHRPAAMQPSSIAASKARLLAWAAEHDVLASGKRRKLAMRAVGGAAAAVGVLTLARALTPRKQGNVLVRGERGSPVRSTNWALIARAGLWLVPRAISAAQNASRRRKAT